MQRHPPLLLLSKHLSTLSSTSTRCLPLHTSFLDEVTSDLMSKYLVVIKVTHQLTGPRKQLVPKERDGSGLNQSTPPTPNISTPLSTTSTRYLPLHASTSSIPFHPFPGSRSPSCPTPAGHPVRLCAFMDSCSSGGHPALGGEATSPTASSRREFLEG